MLWLIEYLYMTIDQFKIPPNWNSDKLSRFIHLAMHNSVATFNNKKDEYETLKNINDCFEIIKDDFKNTTNIFEALLLMRSHSSYYAACRLAMSGQVPETFVMLRNGLENALYALHIKRNQKAGDIWLKRHDNEKSLKATRNEFTYKKIITTLEKTDRSLFATAKVLYETSIDSGAHPNEQAITSSLTVNISDDKIDLKQVYLTVEDLQIVRGLKSTAQVGLCSLYIFRHIFKEQFDIMGITSIMDRYRSKL